MTRPAARWDSIAPCFTTIAKATSKPSGPTRCPGTIGSMKSRDNSSGCYPEEFNRRPRRSRRRSASDTAHIQYRLLCPPLCSLRPPVKSHFEPVQKERPDNRSGLTHFCAPENGCSSNEMKITDLLSPTSHQYWGQGLAGLYT